MEYLFVSGEDRAFDAVTDRCRKYVAAELDSEGSDIDDALGRSGDLILACEGCNIVGFAALSSKAKEVYINQIVVKNRFRKQGIGTALIAEVIKVAGNRDVTCHVRFSNEASRTLFSGCGFQEDETKKTKLSNFYIKPGRMFNKSGNR